MNREIKFRAWDKNRNEWYLSYIFICEDGELYSDDVLIFNTPNKEITLSKDNLIIEQYTGLKDKNGKEIYEGDVIKTHFSFSHEVDQEPFIITWNEDKAMFEGIKPEKCENDYLRSFSFFPEQRFIYEIIGNIHENPELLEAHND